MTTRRADVVMFSTADWASQYWTNKQHTAAHLAARGHRVLYVETVGLRRPGLNSMDVGRIWARLRRGLKPIAEVRDNLWVLSPLTVPLGQRYAPIAAFNRWQLRARIGGWLRKHRIGRPLIWTYHPYMLEAAEALDPSAMVYHCVDDIGAVPGVDRAAYDAAEQRLLRRVDLAFTTSGHLQQRCAAIAGERARYFGNVADIDHFATARGNIDLPPELAAIPRPRLGYVGVISDFKIDLELLQTLAVAHPDWHFVFIGDEREGQHSDVVTRMAQLSNVHFLGWRSYQDLPRYLAGFDVGLLPQLINDYTRAMFPMKFFEYLAAGLPVVATPLPALRDLAAVHGIGADTATFAQAISAALDGRGPQPLPIDDPLLQANSWDARLDQMLAMIEATSAASPRG
ncbi:glycosyltransferase [Rhodopseudomonas palustris]|uniref:Glycosyl transferase, group 1 n=1 Tax=Rhodopseudomonas palustris (strain BisB18) TaxID=316056 RepID=Q20YQ8_RHOPB